MKFVEFCAHLKVRLTPGQMALARAGFDGEAVEDGVGRELFGMTGAVSPMSRGVLTVVAGARSGKTYLMALRLLHLAVTVDLSHLAPGEDAYAVVVAPQKDLAQQAVRYALGAIKQEPRLLRFLDGRPSAEEFVIKRDGKRVVFRAIAASAGGVSGRGRSLVGALLDECAFFRDEQYQVNDAEVFNAIEPRIVEGGQVLVASTPWGEAGLLFDLWQDNFGAPKRSLVAHATTERMRKDGPAWPKVAWQIDSARERDPENARREFDAEFMSGAAGTFFDPVAVDQAVRPNEVLFDPKPRAQVVCGGDFGFKHDSSALVILQLLDGRAYLSRLVERKPEKGRALKPSEVAHDFAVEMKRFGASSVMADAYHRESMQEHLSNNGIALLAAPEGQSGKTLTYNRAKERLYEGKIVLPQIDRLTRQLKEVVAKPTSGGGISIQSPRWKQGGHGDLVSALVLALYQMHGSEIVEKKVLSWGEQQKEALFAREERARKDQIKWQRNVTPVWLVS